MPETPQDRLIADLAAVGPSVCLCCWTCVVKAQKTLREAGFEVRRIAQAGSTPDTDVEPGPYYPDGTHVRDLVAEAEAGDASDYG